ncbi:sporulation protein 24 [Monosporozyma unispora]
MAFLQLATEVSQPFIIKGLSPITPSSSRKNSYEDVTTASATKDQQPRQRHNSLSLL